MLFDIVNVDFLTEHQPLYAVSAGKIPAPQSKQIDNPEFDPYVPAPHAEHVTLPNTGAYLPTSHESQSSVNTVASMCGNAISKTTNANVLVYFIVLLFTGACLHVAW